MGCDIHLFVEKKENGVWNAVRGVNQSSVEKYKEWSKESKNKEYWLQQYKEEL